MKFFVIQIYVKQILEQCQFIIMAHEDMRRAVDKSRAVRDNRKGPFLLDEETRTVQDANRELWYSAQALLSSSANVAKVFWPGGKTRATARAAAATREPVRRALGVNNDTTWQAARKIRNSFDHWDDRVEEWDKSGETMMIEGIGGPLPIDGHTDKAQWRNYDPQAETLHFWGARLSVGDIDVEARRLITAAEDVLILCPECSDAGTLHRSKFPRERGYPAPIGTKLF